MKRLVVSLSILMLVPGAVAVAQEHPFAISDLLKVRRVADPQLSPKGDLVAYTVTDIDKEANRGVAQIYVVPIGGGTARQLTSDAKGSASPRWSPDGSRIAFIREDQIWTMDASGGTLKQIPQSRPAPPIRSGHRTAIGLLSPQMFIPIVRTTPATRGGRKPLPKAK
jgi:hypothetical protein